MSYARYHYGYATTGTPTQNCGKPSGPKTDSGSKGGATRSAPPPPKKK